MGRSSGRGRHPYLPPVKNIDVQTPNVKKRLIVIAVLFVIGVIALGIGLYQSRKWEDGWKIVESDNVLGCASEISFHYYLAGDGARERASEIATIYTQLCGRADYVYAVTAEEAEAKGAASEAGEGEANLANLNANPNTVLEAAPELYRTLEKLEELGTRIHLLGPVYESYDGIFSCTEDRETVDCDPWQNPDLKEEYAQVAAFAANPDDIRIELLGGGRICLHVSERYLAFAKEHGTRNFVDLYYLRNAAILDDMADALREKGWTQGYFQSANGYGVNLLSEGEFSVNVANGKDGIVAQLAAVPPMAFAALRNYALTELDKQSCYTFTDGSTRAKYVDQRDGLPKAAKSDLLLLSKEEGCLALAVMAATPYALEEFGEDDFPAKGLSAIWCEGITIRVAGDDVKFSEVAEGYTVE